MNEHTPGPWERDCNTVWSPSAQEEGAVVASLPNTTHSTKDADAALITAAPELLAALRLTMSRGHANRCPALQNSDKACSNKCTAARMAIAKAEGSR